jgi:hypothetical protein
MRRYSASILWVTVTSLVLGGAYYGFEALLDRHAAGGSRGHAFILSVSALRTGSEFPTFRVRQGDAVTWVIRSDRVGEVHVHVYEKKIVLKPGGEVTLTFSAENAGLFPIHLHDPDGSMYPLAMLEVQPR